MTPQKRPKRPWSRSDKLLVIVPTALVALACGLFFWLRTLDREPIIVLPPPPPMPAVNARDYFLAAANAAAVTGSVAPNSQAVRLLHQGFQYPYQEAPQTVLQSPIQQIRSLSVLSEQLSKLAQADAKNGQWNASVNAGLDAIQLGVAVMHGADVRRSLFSICQGAGSKPLWDDLNHLTRVQARAAARRLEIICANRVPYVDVLVVTKKAAQRGLVEDMKRANWRDEWVTTSPPLWKYPRIWTNHALSTTRLRLTSNKDILAANKRYMDTLITAARHPYAARPPAPSLPTDMVNQFMFQPSDNYWAMILVTDNQSMLLMTAFALRAYQLDHGTYPATLSALVPGYLKAVPADPFALSGPLRYRRVGAKYVLYSVGPDGKDDSGKPISNNWISKDSKGDIVAGVNIY